MDLLPCLSTLLQQRYYVLSELFFLKAPALFYQHAIFADKKTIIFCFDFFNTFDLWKRFCSYSAFSQMDTPKNNIMKKFVLLSLLAAFLFFPISLLAFGGNVLEQGPGTPVMGEVTQNLNLFKVNNSLKLDDETHKPGRFSFKIGGGLHYLESELSDITSDFDSDRLAFLANAQLAIRYGVRTYGNNQDRGTAFGLFGRYGFLPDMGLDGDFPFWEIEAGWVFREWIRASAGIGNQNYEFNGYSMDVSYYTATTGIVLRFGKLEFDLNLTGMVDEDFEEDPSFRVNATVNLHFKGGGR